MSDVGKAIQLKEEGNRFYQQKNYAGAEGLYSKASCANQKVEANTATAAHNVGAWGLWNNSIIADPKNPALYTNRAMARIKLLLWHHVVDDCKQALHLDSHNMKAHYQLSQAQLELGAFQESVESGEKAHELCLKHNDKSLFNITSQLRKSIKARWDDMERRRVRAYTELEQETRQIFQVSKSEAISGTASEVERNEISEEWDSKISRIGEIFEKARPEEQKIDLQPPSWLLCPISFQVMLDPVMTRAGHTYDRQNIEQHVKQHQVDPFTREPLYLSDLRPNLAIKEACQAYLKEHGDAAEY
ncbi:STIP1 homology and U box-containing protein 1 [Zalerion maritima]|uniref:STIP1 homology and U box-containing protein 1 n=1 Tax=Zalerion maritima TaxID=339359 RepID=A0AAD5RJ12_9PEZI|nr:STIP1 homology and U box-containing protein 1 [Zalerion maritima]